MGLSKLTPVSVGISLPAPCMVPYFDGFEIYIWYIYYLLTYVVCKWSFQPHKPKILKLVGTCELMLLNISNIGASEQNLVNIGASKLMSKILVLVD